MSVESVDEAMRLIRDRRDACFVGPRPPELIVRAEDTLTLTFPPSFRRFVEHVGAGSVGSFEVYGVTTEPFDGPVPDGVWVTLNSRTGPSQLPTSMVVVSVDGMGGEYVLDTALGREPPVQVWNGRLSRPGEPLEQVADNFGFWLLQAVRQERQP